MGRYTKKRKPSQPELIGSFISNVLDTLGIEEKFSAAKILSQWSEIVGKDISVNTRPERVSDETLFVNVANSAWLMELSRFYKDDILKKIRNATQDTSIKNIVFKLGKV